MSKKIYEEMTAGTMADSSTNVDDTYVRQTIAKPLVSGSLSEPQTELQRERLIFQKGWCSAFNTWWKYKDEPIDFREMETKLCEAMEAEWKEHLSNYR